MANIRVLDEVLVAPLAQALKSVGLVMSHCDGETVIRPVCTPPTGYEIEIYPLTFGNLDYHVELCAKGRAR